MSSPRRILLSLGRRLAQAALALWAIASLVFLLSRRGPISAEEVLLPDRSELSGAGGSSSARQQAAHDLRHRLGLDLPLFYCSREAPAAGRPRWHWHGGHNQYQHWLKALARGELGRSWRSGQPVAQQLLGAVRFTLPLTGAALVLAVGLALGLGRRLAAPRRWWHGPVRAALVGVSGVPLFVVAVGLLLLLANPEVLAWFPVQGLAGGEASSGAAVGDALAHLALPVASLVLVALPGLTLQLEAAIRHELGTGYATTARSKGLPEAAVIRRHAFPNALMASITQLTDLVPALVAGAVVVEVVYALPGMGRLLAEAAARHDAPVLVGGVLLVGTARLLALLLADVLYQWADPRLR